MKIGTKSVLFGAHQFLLHPLFVAVAWWRLYGFPWDTRLWVAFFVHDLGYIGKPNMDGEEGEQHPILGARIMHAMFDWNWRLDLHTNGTTWINGRRFSRSGGKRIASMYSGERWHDFTLYHSRFYAKREHQNPSRLCVADKLATALMPIWLYLLLTNLTGEIGEYMAVFHHREGGKYDGDALVIDGSQREWVASMQKFLRGWIAEHQAAPSTPIAS